MSRGCSRDIWGEPPRLNKGLLGAGGVDEGEWDNVVIDKECERQLNKQQDSG